MFTDRQSMMAYIILVVLLNGFFSVNMLEKNKRFYSSEIDKQLSVIDNLRTELQEFYKYGVLSVSRTFGLYIVTSTSTPYL